MNRWDGMVFPMGFFLVSDDNGGLRMGKCDPLTREILEWYEIESNTVATHDCSDQIPDFP